MLVWSNLGRCSIEHPLLLQEILHLKKEQGNKNQFLLFAEHEPVYTCDEAKYSESLWRTEERPHPLKFVHRGGSITYHGPGQIVCYAIFNLNEVAHTIISWNVLLDTVIKTYLKECGVNGRKRKDPAAAQGIWVIGGDRKMRKIASRGIRVSGDITTFGFALNLATDITYFEAIYPCGLDIEMTSVLRESGKLIPPHQAIGPLTRIFSETLDMPLLPYPDFMLPSF